MSQSSFPSLSSVSWLITKADKGMSHPVLPNEKGSYDGKADSETNVDVHEAGENTSELIYIRL